MQRANSRASRLPKKQKLATDEPTTEPTILKSANNPAIVEPNIMDPLGTSRKDKRRQGTDEVIVRSGIATTMEEDDETTVARAAERNLCSITHADAITILAEYFTKSAIDSSPLTPVVRSHTPEASTAPPSAGVNAVSTEVAGSLDDSVQWLEDVVMALEYADDNSRTPDSSVPGVLDDVLTATINHTISVNIMSSVMENWAKCNGLIARPALEAAQERLGKVDQNKLHGCDWSNPDKATCWMPKLGFLSNRLRFSHIGLFCATNFLQCVRGGWLERKLSVVAGDRGSWIDLRTAAETAKKLGQTMTGPGSRVIARVARSRNALKRGLAQDTRDGVQSQRPRKLVRESAGKSFLSIFAQPLELVVISDSKPEFEDNGDY